MERFKIARISISIRPKPTFHFGLGNHTNACFVSAATYPEATQFPLFPPATALLGQLRKVHQVLVLWAFDTNPLGTLDTGILVTNASGRYHCIRGKYLFISLNLIRVRPPVHPLQSLFVEARTYLSMMNCARSERPRTDTWGPSHGPTWSMLWLIKMAHSIDGIMNDLSELMSMGQDLICDIRRIPRTANCRLSSGRQIDESTSSGCC